MENPQWPESLARRVERWEPPLNPPADLAERVEARLRPAPRIHPARAVVPSGWTAGRITAALLGDFLTRPLGAAAVVSLCLLAGVALGQREAARYWRAQAARALLSGPSAAPASTPASLSR